MLWIVPFTFSFLSFLFQGKVVHAFLTLPLQVSFFIFAVAMPCAYVLCLLVLWMVPLTYKFQSRLLTLTSTIHAWSALEVFVISIIAALLELQQFAQFIIGNRCDMINKVLKHFGMYLHAHLTTPEHHTPHIPNTTSTFSLFLRLSSA